MEREWTMAVAEELEGYTPSPTRQILAHGDGRRRRLYFWWWGALTTTLPIRFVGLGRQVPDYTHTFARARTQDYFFYWCWADGRGEHVWGTSAARTLMDGCRARRLAAGCVDGCP